MAVVTGAGVNLKPSADRQILPTGFYYNASGAANTFYPTFGFAITVPSGLGTANVTNNFAYRFPFACSIVAANMIAAGSATGNWYMRIYKNGSIVATLATGTGTANYQATFAKGTYTFAVADILSIYVGCSTAGSINAQTSVTLDSLA
jgi:hypothetical protein